MTETQHVWITLYEDDEAPLIYVYATEELAESAADELRANNERDAQISVIQYRVLNKPGLPRY